MTPTEHIQKIISSLGIKAEINDDHFVHNQVETIPVIIHGVTVEVQYTCYANGGIGAEVTFSLPEEGVLAETYIRHVAKKENLKKNHGHEYHVGPDYRDYASGLLKKDTIAYSPWNNHYLVIASKYYDDNEADEAVKNLIALARPFIGHLPDLKNLRYWKTTDPEVIAKAKEIIANADLQETDDDREYRAHYLRDSNSFFHGWFYPFNDRGRGTFDTLWPSSVDQAAKGMGNEGTFEYAVASVLLEDKKFIAKGRAACRIRKETVTECW